MTWLMLSSGIEKRTDIGCSCVTTTIAVAPLDDEIAGIDLAEADASRDRRSDAAIFEIDAVRFHGRLVGHDRALVRSDCSDLS